MDARPTATWRPPTRLVRTAAYAACLLVIGAAVWAGLLIVGRLMLLMFPVVVGIYLTRILIGPVDFLRARRWPPALAAATALVGFIAVVVLVGVLIGRPMVSEFEDLGPTLDDGLSDVEDWLVEDSGLDVTREDVEEFEDDAVERARTAVTNSQDRVVEGLRLALSLLAGLVLALVLTFFTLKDGPRFQSWALGRTPERHRVRVPRAAAAAWDALGGYLRGSATLGVIEGVVIGGTMALVGASLVIPVMVLTFAAAFVPIVGATVAGIIAVLVTLATAGVVDAVIVAGVAIAVQQLDNDLLAPWVFGKALSLHPVTILLSLTAGTALFGFVGTVLAVPVTAVAVAVVTAWNETPAPDAGATMGGPPTQEPS